MQALWQMEARRPAARKALAAALLLAGVAGASAGEAAHTTYGDKVRFGSGTARTYLVHDAQGAPVSLGIEVTEAALAKLPKKPTTVQLKFPAAATQETQYTFAMFDWMPQGHEPPGVYDAPHFDFHFYMVPAAQVKRIKGGEDPRVVSATFVPPDYIAPGNAAVPAMGVHWVDKTAPEFNGKPFDKTFLYGASAGEITFFEPMVTLEYLKAKQDFSAEVKQPQAVQKTGHYPQRYSVRYLPDRKVYQVSLDELVRRDASK